MGLKASFIFRSPPFPACHAATITETPGGLIAACFGGSREGAADVEIWVMHQEGYGWSMPYPTATGQEKHTRYPCWNPVLYQALGGELLLFYKVGPAPDRWWGMLMESTDQGLTWQPPRRLPDGILGPAKNKPVRLPNGSLLCPSSSEHDGWRVHIEITGDLGMSWQRFDVPGQYQAIQPCVLEHADGGLQLLCRSTCGWIVTAWSQDGGFTWSALEKISLPNPNSGIDAVSLTDGRHLLVYNYAGMETGRWGGKRTPLNLAVSQDGIRWKPTLVLEKDQGEYSYPAVIQDAHGKVHIVYTWKRQNLCHVELEPDELGDEPDAAASLF
jgi:predicted neuraminidase